MSGRDDLEELHALAASISEDAHGWRAHRRQRAHATAQARAQAELIAPINRRKRHRWIAGSVVGVLVVVGAALVITHQPAAPAAKPSLTIVTVRHEPADVRVGQTAAVELTAQGRSANVFACEGLYDSEQMGSIPGQEGLAWRAGYLAACSHAASADGNAG
jgi:hypothetical protein